MRVDLYLRVGFGAVRNWIDVIGGVLFLLPICLILTWFTWRLVRPVVGHRRGLAECRRPAALAGQAAAALGFALMALQGISEIIKRIAALCGLIGGEFEYQKPLQ